MACPGWRWAAFFGTAADYDITGPWVLFWPKRRGRKRKHGLGERGSKFPYRTRLEDVLQGNCITNLEWAIGRKFTPKALELLNSLSASPLLSTFFQSYWFYLLNNHWWTWLNNQETVFNSLTYSVWFRENMYLRLFTCLLVKLIIRGMQ